MTKVILDTDMLSEVLKGKHPKVVARHAEYLRVHQRLTTTALTIAEIAHGVYKRRAPARLQKVLRELANVEVLPLDSAAALLAGQILADLERDGRPIGSADPLIAGICIDHALPLVTGNTEHFERIQRLGYPLQLQTWR